MAYAPFICDLLQDNNLHIGESMASLAMATITPFQNNNLLIVAASFSC